jgi:hypothetical protein
MQKNIEKCLTQYVIRRMNMRIEIVENKEKFNHYADEGKHEAVIDFQLMFHGLKDKQDFDAMKYALTEAVANAIRDFEKAFNIGRGY